MDAAENMVHSLLPTTSTLPQFKSAEWSADDYNLLQYNYILGKHSSHIILRRENQEIHQRGDSDDEIAELRFQALLTKKENEAEVSPAHKPMPVDNSLSQAAINQPLSNFRGQPFNYRGRGSSHYYNKPYLHTFSQSYLKLWEKKMLNLIRSSKSTTCRC
ncbi:hypothetical protein Avbf_01848 [Armadillidium vulgare]|nr:hypothetical protein Avbf_01848 [Armadillidium vulgare]